MSKTLSQIRKTSESTASLSLAKRWAITEICRPSNSVLTYSLLTDVLLHFFKKRTRTRERQLIKPFNFFTFRQIKWTVCKKWKRKSEKFQLLIKSLLMVENKIFSKRRRFRSNLAFPVFTLTYCMEYLWKSSTFRHFCFTTKTAQPRPQVFSVKGALTCNITGFLTTSVDLIAKFFQSRSTVAGYGEFCVCFYPFRNGEIFWMNNNDR